jgi:hypothetical protein
MDIWPNKANGGKLNDYREINKLSDTTIESQKFELRRGPRRAVTIDPASN